MALSENLSRIEPWLFPSRSAVSCIYEAFAGETETLTKAINESFTGNTYSDSIVSNTAPTPTASTVSGSVPEISTPKSRKNAVPVSCGKFSKRKSRASKQSQTAFIAADPANFRQMVQQVTGVRFGDSQMPAVAPIMKPVPQRTGIRTTGAGLCLPTLDTSAFLLDHPPQNVTMGSAGSGAGPLGFQADEVNGGFETFSSFPTLESWKVM